MTVVACRMDCKHRSKRPLRKYKYKDGSKCYACTLEGITITHNFGEVKAVAGERNMAMCNNYEPLERDD